MEVFTDLGQYAGIFSIVGAVLFMIGFFMKAGAKKETFVAVLSMLFMTIGGILLLIAISKFVTDAFQNWGEVSDSMRR